MQQGRTDEAGDARQQQLAAGESLGEPLRRVCHRHSLDVGGSTGLRRSIGDQPILPQHPARHLLGPVAMGRARRDPDRQDVPAAHRSGGRGGLADQADLRDFLTGSRGTSVGLTLSRTTSLVTTTFATSSRLGTSYITLRSTSSMIARRPRASVPRNIAWSAIASIASSPNSSSTPSRSNSRAYCFTSALRGWVRISISASRSSESTVAMTGRRPMNSGIRPYFSRSSGMTWAKIWSRSDLVRDATSVLKPSVGGAYAGLEQIIEQRIGKHTLGF